MTSQNQKCALHIAMQELTPLQISLIIEKAFAVFVKEQNHTGLEIMDKIYPYFLKMHSMENSN